MAPAQDLTGLLLDGRYRLTRLMGEGGMGQVYEGMHQTLDRRVAVKVLLPRYAYEPKYRERFLREAKAASKVRHPNVVQILDFGDTPGGSVYFVMELLEGRDLAALLREEGPLAWPRARHILLQAAAALAAAHEHKIVHRDIKPANFFIGDVRGVQDLVKVLDFGIAKLVVDAGNEESSLAQSLTGTGEVFGTAKYMAPEQAYGDSNDPRVDVYSLGIVAYELLTGRVPFTGVSVFDIITRHVNEPPRPPHELVPGIPAELEAVVLRAMAKQPQDRFASMDAMEQALLAIAPGVPMVVPTVHSVVPPLALPAPSVTPVPPVTPVPSPLLAASPAPPGPRRVSDVVTAPAPARVVAPAPSLGSSTSVIPTRLKAPSPVTSGEVLTNEPTQAPTRAPGLVPNAEDSGIGAATSRVQGAGEASPTGSMLAPASGSRVADTDPHARYTASRSRVASRKPSFVLGLLGTLGGAGAVLAGYLVVVSSEPPAEADAQLEPAKATVPASAAGGAPLPAGEPAGPPSVVVHAAPPPSADGQAPVPSQPAPSDPVPAVQPASAPAKAKVQTPKPASKPASKPTKPPAPLTDGAVMSRLEASMKKKCRAHASDAVVAVKLIVANDGRVINKNGAVTGASPAQKACLVEQLAAARFPAAGTTRNLSASLRW